MSDRRNKCNMFALFFVTCILLLNLVTTRETRLQKRYTEKDICHETKQTLEEVKACPKNSTTFEEKMLEKNCNRFEKCMGQKLKYHCVMFEGKLVEVCAPRSSIRGHCCPFYDKGLGRVIEDFSRRCPKCPVHYFSDDYQIFKSCTEPRCGGEGNRHKRDCPGGEKHDSTSKDPESSTQIVPKSTQPEREPKNDEQLNTSIIVPLFVIVCVLLPTVTMSYRERKRLKILCKVSKGKLNNVRNNQNTSSLQITSIVLSENTEECKMLPD